MNTHYVGYDMSHDYNAIVCHCTSYLNLSTSVCDEVRSYVSSIQNYICKPAPDVSNPEENGSCPNSTRPMWPMCDTAGANPFMTYGSWPNDSHAGHSSWRRGISLRFWSSRFATGIHLMKQFAHNVRLSCCQCTEACSYVSPIQNRSHLAITVNCIFTLSVSTLFHLSV